MTSAKPKTRTEVEEALRRLRHALAEAGPDTAAGIAFALAVERHERLLGKKVEPGRRS